MGNVVPGCLEDGFGHCWVHLGPGPNLGDLFGPCWAHWALLGPRFGQKPTFDCQKLTFSI